METLDDCTRLTLDDAESLHFLRDYIYTNPFWPRPFFIYIHCQSGNPTESPSPAAPRPGAGQPRLVDGFV
jgi:hypothetical protein